MKKYFMAFLFALFIIPLLIVNVVVAADVNATFEWTQPDYDNVNYWKLYWGEAAGGPYEVGELQFDKADLQENQSATFTIPYPDGAQTTYYFVLVAFQDATHYSGNSNEVFLEIDFIPTPGAPLQLRVTIVPQ